MKSSSKKRVAVLRGGPSSEHSISISSGKHVLSNIDTDKYVPVDIYIDKSGVWHHEGVATTPALALKFIDTVFNACHGEYGEDGSIQSLLDDIGIPYNGTKSFESKVTIDKNTTNILLKKKGILMPKTKIVRPSAKDIDVEIAEIWRSMQHPLIVKPVASGSSVALSLCKDYKTLEKAVKLICSSGHSTMVQEYIKGREVSVAIVEGMRGQDVYAAVPISVQHGADVFSNTIKKSKKYSLGPMKGFSDTERELVIKLAKYIHTELGLRHYSVSDFIIADKGVCFLEINSLPGLTEHSILPSALSESGISIKDFLTHVIEKSEK